MASLCVSRVGQSASAHVETEEQIIVVVVLQKWLVVKLIDIALLVLLGCIISFGRSLGMEETLLDLLDRPDDTVELTLQYRMNEEILRLSNQLTYDNKLECATEEIRTNTLQLTRDETTLVSFAHNHACTLLSTLLYYYIVASVE